MMSKTWEEFQKRVEELKKLNRSVGRDLKGEVKIGYEVVRIGDGTIVEITVPTTKNRLDRIINEAFSDIPKGKICFGTINGIFTIVSF